MSPPRPSMPLPTAVRWAHEVLRPRLRAGDAAIDCTAGNGHDTLFLAQNVLPGGAVHAFDVQPAAIDATRARLLAANIASGGPGDAVCLHLAGHQTFPDVLPPALRGGVRAFMFNLGFLPGGDKGVITKAGSTLPALAAAAEWLEEDGVLTLAAYPGHTGGREEAEAVQAWMAGLPSDAYEVQKIGFLNFRPATPFLLVLRKRTAAPPGAAPPAGEGPGQAAEAC